MVSKGLNPFSSMTILAIVNQAANMCVSHWTHAASLIANSYFVMVLRRWTLRGVGFLGCFAPSDAWAMAKYEVEPVSLQSWSILLQRSLIYRGEMKPLSWEVLCQYWWRGINSGRPLHVPHMGQSTSPNHGMNGESSCWEIVGSKCPRWPLYCLWSGRLV